MTYFDGAQPLLKEPTMNKKCYLAQGIAVEIKEVMGGQGRDRTVDLPIFSPVDFVPKDVFWLQKIDFPGFLTGKSVIRTRGVLHVL